MTATRPRTTRSTRARPTDDDLLDAARAVFAEHGFRTATMSAVAERSDSTKPTLYAHFGDKEALYARLLDREADTCRQWLFGAYERNSGLGLAAQVAADTEAFFDYVRAHPDGFAVLFGNDVTSATARDRLTADIEARIARQVHSYLVAHGRVPSGTRPSRDERLLAALLVGVAFSAARNAKAGGHSMTRACAIASAFSAAALENISVRAR